MTSQEARMTVAAGIDHKAAGNLPVAAGSAYGEAAIQDAKAQQAAKPAEGMSLRGWWKIFAILPFVASVSGCGLLAVPCRVASAGLKIIPVVGHPLATPFDGCAAVID